MENRKQRRRLKYWWIGLHFSFMLCFGRQVSAQIRYSFPEEVKEGFVVGNIAEDLGIDVSTLVDRRFRIVSGFKDDLFQVNQSNGKLYISKKVDREELCYGNEDCLITLKLVVENPLEVHHAELEIVDINDHFPSFPAKEQLLKISENTLPGADYQLLAARDPDTGEHAVRFYKLSKDDHFDISIRESEDDKLPFLILKKPLDREIKTNHRLLLTAQDGGTPPRSGTLNITITVLDTNDNRPVFSQDTYSVTLQENAAKGTIVIQLNATDLDEGVNGDVEYSFGKMLMGSILDVFYLDSITGEILVNDEVDFEETEVFKLDVQASDKGQPPMSANCRVVIKVIDINDNSPQIDITSLSNDVPEDSKPGTVISLISLTDKDSGVNGKVLCTLTENVPFELKPSFRDNMYSLVTKESLDREQTPRYDITITATDFGQPPLSAFETLSVQVSDVNDNRPEFSQNPLELYLMENNSPGMSICSVTASDKDLKENAVISYHMIRGDGTQNDMTSFLNINSESGDIYALKSFDYETTKTFGFQVVAADSGTPPLSSNVTVKVFILDENDNAPVILSPVSTNGSAEAVEEIPRNVNAGHLVTKVRAYDADIGYNGWLLFSLQEISDHSLFSLDRYTGQIRTLRSFTETDESEHKLVIVVKDNGNVSRSATATVIIKAVEPKEAFAASDVKSTVKEDEESNVVFYLIITLGSVSALFLISITVLIVMQCTKSTDNPSKYLQDTSYDGTLCHSIQYRSGDKRYMLVGPRMSIGSTIVPSSNGNTLVVPDRRRRGSGEVSIRYSVPEEMKEGSVVGNIASDLGLDVSTLVERRFRIVSGSKDALFRLNHNNGLLYVHKKIDREQLCDSDVACLINLKIVVENPLEIHYVGVEITDINDNSPSFPEKEQHFEIAEHTSLGTRFQVEAARDPDVGINSVRSYRLSRNENFAIDVRDSDEDKLLFLVLKKALDREHKSNYSLILTCFDGGNPPRSGSMNITITVLDSNDNRPIFSEEIYSVTLQENVPNGTVVIKLNATDLDEGEIIVKGDIDFEDSEVYKLDNPFELYLAENNVAGASIFSVSATDKDLNENAVISYHIIRGDAAPNDMTSFLNINSESGNIHALKTFDFETSKMFQFHVMARDSGTPSLSSNVTVYVYILDENDNAPVILSPVSTNGSAETVEEIPRNVNAGHLVTKVRAYDADIGYNGWLLFSLKEVTDHSLFGLDRYTGQIRTLRSFTETDEAQHKLVIVVKDNGNVSLSATATVIIKAVEPKEAFAASDFTMGDGRQREGKREFWWITVRFVLLLCLGKQVSTQIRYSIPEELEEGSTVGNIAKDLGLDVGTLVERRFRIVSGSKDALFQVNQKNGVLYVYKKIDREELCNGNVACSMNLKVVVEHPLEIHNVGVEVTDTNDNAPSFTEKGKRLEIAESASRGTRFQLQAARDPDAGINSVRLYKLSQNEHFELEIRDRGEDKLPFLVLQKPLDREHNAQHNLILTAFDGGHPPKSGSMNITVLVLDVNDNRPIFGQEVYTTQLNENIALGTIVIQIAATDMDDGANGDVSYAFGSDQNLNVYDVFSLDSTTGEIRVTGEIDFEKNTIYKLDIQASDNGQPPLTTDCRVVIKILDVNDNTPTIDVTSLSKEVSEDSKPGTVVSLISVTDKDSGINGRVKCSLSENTPFELKQSGQDNMYSLVTKEPLDRELVSNYVITITATDLGQPPLSTFKTLSVQVSDVNDYRPEFSHNPIELYVVENNRPGASIFSVSASDKDLNENALISYNIIRGDGTQNDMTSFLSVNAENGIIRALKSFDYESIKTFSFHLVATDAGTPSLSSNVTINVFILDENDNAPMILSPVSTNGSAEGVEEIPRNVNAGHLVAKVKAYDADVGYNGWLLFSLQKVTDHSLFSLDRYTGQIRTLRSFTETDEAEHKLVIVVKDNGNVSLSATATVIIKVVEPKEAFAASDVKSTMKGDEENNVTFYLIITLGSVSALFLISIIVLIVMQCSKPTDYSSKYLQDTDYDGTLCHSIQYRSGEKRYMLVGPRMSIGSTQVPGSNGNTLVLPDCRGRESGTVRPHYF
ncbi:protocadherin Fat 4-like [Chanos chanos]|uniref:Protocadherin Fat 4-like n=1 Tax=Chanos chanos TaxID=29144 RepID=A0A6J2UPR4_CHACN|nr:protocadherin Fat 4-like [Chanos chanos]